MVEEMDGRVSLSLSDGTEHDMDINKSKQVASEHQVEHNGQLTVQKKRQSFSCGLQRSCSLDLLSDEHEFGQSEAGLRAQVCTRLCTVHAFHKDFEQDVLSF